MTYKGGFVDGFVIGFFALFLLNSHTIYPESAIPFVALADFLAVIVAPVLSIFIGISTALRGKHVFSTTTDGAIYGFTAILDVVSLLILVFEVFVLHRYLPFPW